MDLVSFNTPGEYEMFSEIMKRGMSVLCVDCRQYVVVVPSRSSVGIFPSCKIYFRLF